MSSKGHGHSRPDTSDTAARQKRRKLRKILLGVVPAVVVLVSSLIYLFGGRYVETDNAYLKAEKIPVSAEVSGTIKEVLVGENQPVQAGQLLFRIDPAPFQLEVSKAKAKLAQAKTDLAVLQAAYHEKQSEISLARTRHNFAMKEQKRQADLLAKHYVPVANYDTAKQNAELASQQITTSQRDLKRIAEALGGRVDMPLEQQPSYLSAQAELEQAELDLSRVEVRAPRAGIASKTPSQGQFISAGNTAMAVVVNGKVWVEANFIETDLTYVRPGQPVTIHVDTYPDTTWQGTVESLSPATGAEFSLIPAQNSTGNWVKIVQRVPVRIKLDLAKGLPQLRAGLSSEVEIDTGHRRRLLGLSL